MIFTLMTFYLFAGDSDLIFFAALANVLLMVCGAPVGGGAADSNRP